MIENIYPDTISNYGSVSDLNHLRDANPNTHPDELYACHPVTYISLYAGPDQCVIFRRIDPLRTEFFLRLVKDAQISAPTPDPYNRQDFDQISRRLNRPFNNRLINSVIRT